MTKTILAQIRPTLSIVRSAAPAEYRGAALRNPPAPISFALSERRPSFDLVAELIHSASALRAATEGGTVMNLSSFSNFVRMLLKAAIKQAEAKSIKDAITRDSLNGDTEGLKCNFSMVILACLRHATPALVPMAEGFQESRERITALISDATIAGDANCFEFLEFIDERANGTFFQRDTKKSGKTLGLHLSEDTRQHVAKLAYDLGVDYVTAVELGCLWTFSTQHHFVESVPRKQADDYVRRYELRARHAALTVAGDLAVLLAYRDACLGNAASDE